MILRMEKRVFPVFGATDTLICRKRFAKESKPQACFHSALRLHISNVLRVKREKSAYSTRTLPEDDKRNPVKAPR